MLDVEALKLQEVRDFLEICWIDWRSEKGLPVNPIPSNKMCRFTSSFLLKYLNSIGMRGWYIAGGTPYDTFCNPVDHGGILSSSGIWESHYWVTNGHDLIDLTADQFGYDSIIVSSIYDHRYCENYLPNEILEHMTHVDIRSTAWLKDLETFLSPIVSQTL